MWLLLGFKQKQDLGVINDNLFMSNIIINKIYFQNLYGKYQVCFQNAYEALKKLL